MKETFSIVLFSVLLSYSALAQSSNDNSISANVRVNAQVIQTIELITVNTMQFGNTSPGQQEVYVNPVNDLNAGYMIAVGTPEAEFRLNYLPERELTQVNGDGTLTFIYEISGSPQENQEMSELLEVDNRNIQFNEEGRYYIWLGGRVNLENARPGNYEGDFTIEIDYI